MDRPQPSTAETRVFVVKKSLVKMGHRIVSADGGVVKWGMDEREVAIQQKISLHSRHLAYLQNGYLPELDGIRAICVLLVISVHMHAKVWGWLNGQHGVTVFFILSGYLITTLSVKEEVQRGALSLTAFYVRRSFRIFPLYYAVLALYCLLILGVGIGPEKRDMLVGALPYYLAYMQEYPFVYGVDGEFSNLPFFHSWSLGIEEKFYFVWPVFAFVILRQRWRLRGATILAAAFAIGPMVLRALGRPDISGLTAPYFHILIGCVVALMLREEAWFRRVSQLLSRLTRYSLLLAFGVLHFTQPHIPGGWFSHTSDLLYSILAASALVIVVLSERYLRGILRARPLVWIGTLSYGIYLIHVLALAVAEKLAPNFVAALLLACVLSILAAWVMHHTVEKPFIALGRRWSAKLMVPLESERQRSLTA